MRRKTTTAPMKAATAPKRDANPSEIQASPVPESKASRIVTVSLQGNDDNMIGNIHLGMRQFEGFRAAQSPCAGAALV